MTDDLASFGHVNKPPHFFIPLSMPSQHITWPKDRIANTFNPVFTIWHAWMNLSSPISIATESISSFQTFLHWSPLLQNPIVVFKPIFTDYNGWVRYVNIVWKWEGKKGKFDDLIIDLVAECDTFTRTQIPESDETS